MLPAGEFLIGQVDVLLGGIGDSPFYISRSHYEFWKHSQLIIDAVEGRGGMFSLEGTEGKSFLTRSRLFFDEEWAELVESGVMEPEAPGVVLGGSKNQSIRRRRR